MKIMHVITGLSSGGAEAVLFRLTTTDKQNSHQVISLMDEGIYGERLISSGIQVHTLNMPRGRVTIRGISKLYMLFKNIKPDIVQTWMYHPDLIGGILARLAGVSSVIWGIRGPFNRELTSLQTNITIRLCALFSKWVPSMIVSNSQHAAEVHEQAGYTSNKLICIPNGYPLDRFQPDEKCSKEFRREFNINHDDILIGMVARFDPYKDHENLFSALSILSREERQIACVLVGSDMKEGNQTLVKLIEKYDVQDMITLVGLRDDIPKVMAAIDIHVLSSVAESFPNVLAEAMACGTPCITTDVGDAALIVGNTGWVVPQSDPDVLAGAIRDALSEKGNLAKWGGRKEACRKRVVENYTLERMIKSYNKVWGDAINDKR